ncbi:MAG TPA: ABC transporter ATP-binding protein [Burkholderiaceae bacterium]|nr:ABC transporter ATP-binding protein [Burkholderiaceae bacterium]
MPLIEFRHVAKRYGDRTVLADFSLDVSAGEFSVILGPAGSGKSTILRALCGIEDIDAGSIRIDGRNVSTMAPRERGCVLVSQGDALYPKLTVAQNIAHPLKLAGIPRDERDATIADLARTLRLDDVLGRRPGELTCGERLRVAIARACARQPRVLLFDEPWSDLDPATRMELQFELVSLHWRLDATMVLVTRDQAAAMALADRVAVINRGEVEQSGTPRQIFGAPASPFVAGYVGQPPMNLMFVGASDAGLRLRGKPDLALPESLAAALSRRLAGDHHDDFLLGIRPQHVELGVDSGIPARVLGSEVVDDLRIVHLDISGQHAAAVAADGQHFPTGARVGVAFPPQACHVFLPPAPPPVRVAREAKVLEPA